MSTPTIRERMEAHAKNCRDALDRFADRPPLPKDLAEDLWKLVVSGDGARLDGANLVDANLDGASLDRASLVGARLDGASLVGASLDRASLVGASLDGYTLAAGPVRAVSGGRYHALTAPSKAGRILKFGCETRTLAQWREEVDALCELHEPDCKAEFRREILALVAWCETLDAEGGAS